MSIFSLTAPPPRFRREGKRKPWPSLHRSRYHVGIDRHELLAVGVHRCQQLVVAARGGKGFRVEILDPVPLLQRSPHLDVAVREDSDSHDGGDEHRPETRYRPPRRPRPRLPATQHLAHYQHFPLLFMEPETRKNDQDFSFRCPSDSCACKSRSRAFLNLSESALSMRRCISFAVSRSPLDCLNSTFSRIARSATTSAISASARAPATAVSAAPPFALLSITSRHHSANVLEAF